jgi:hypothetical protein
MANKVIISISYGNNPVSLYFMAMAMAREHVLSNFNMDNIIIKNIKFYNKIKT